MLNLLHAAAFHMQVAFNLNVIFNFIYICNKMIAATLRAGHTQTSWAKRISLLYKTSFGKLQKNAKMKCKNKQMPQNNNNNRQIWQLLC